MRSSGTRARLYLTVTGALCIFLLGACSNTGSSSGASSTATGGTSTATSAVTNACALLTQAEVAQATGKSIAFAKQANAEPVSTCTNGSLSGFAVVLSVTSSPAAGLSSDIPGLGNVVTKYHLSPVSGVGDQAYAGPDAIIARKGNSAFAIVYASFGGGNHEPALKKMATDVVSRL
jgi:hypothetical protein